MLSDDHHSQVPECHDGKCGLDRFNPGHYILRFSRHFESKCSILWSQDLHLQSQSYNSYIVGNNFEFIYKLSFWCWSQTVTVTVKLASYPSIPAVTASLAVSVTCQVQTLTFSTAMPSTTTILIGITAQPYLIHFNTTKVPNCAQNPSFNLSPNTDAFSSLINIVSGAGDYRVQGATLTNKGTYNYSIAAAVDSKMATSNFQIILKDPCSTAVF